MTGDLSPSVKETLCLPIISSCQGPQIGKDTLANLRKRKSICPFSQSLSQGAAVFWSMSNNEIETTNKLNRP